MRLSAIRELAGTVQSVRLALTAAQDYRERAERRRTRLATNGR